MPKPIQLNIPTPCHENWANMRPEEKGRYCGSCQKTVVDFSAMTDTEVVHFFMNARENVCGRLAPDQLSRDLVAVDPPKKSRWRFWQWAVTGVLMAFGEPGSHRSGTKEVVERKVGTDHKNDQRDFGMVGAIAFTKISKKVPEPVPKIVKCEGEKMGEIAIAPLKEDTINDTPAIHIEAPKTIPSPPLKELEGWAGGIVVGIRVEKEDTPALIQAIKDTLSVFLPKKELVVYPNPVRKGEGVHISWQTEPGTYQVSLFSMSGALVSQRVLEVTGKDQVNDWAIPSGIASGVYLIRAVTTNGKNYTRQLIVE